MSAAALGGAQVPRAGNRVGAGSIHHHRLPHSQALRINDSPYATRLAIRFRHGHDGSTLRERRSRPKATVEAASRLEGELIAAQSQLQGLEQIYSKDSVRVRSLQATVNELSSQLRRIGGDSSAPSPNQNAASGKSAAQEFPSIRQLPLLGVKWADLYRETKVQETVYELLTQQYELAKIQEAKEIPTVKVLDAAYVPEKKSFPPRLLIMILGMLLAVCAGAVWILGRWVWQQMDASDPRKQLGHELLATSVSYWSKWKSRRGF